MRLLEQPRLALVLRWVKFTTGFTEPVVRLLSLLVSGLLWVLLDLYVVADMVCCVVNTVSLLVSGLLLLDLYVICWCLDNVLNVWIVDVYGNILDRESMGEDLFWALRGGSCSSFGVVLSWELNLVEVPETVAIFNISRTLEQNATQRENKFNRP